MRSRLEGRCWRPRLYKGGIVTEYGWHSLAGGGYGGSLTECDSAELSKALWEI